MKTLCIILARAGSKGLPGKNLAEVGGRPMIAHTIGHARAARRPDRIVLSTDGRRIARAARDSGVEVVERPAALAEDTAPVDAAARHALQRIETDEADTYEAVVILYGNVPLRPPGLIDRALQKLETTGCDSVQSISPVGKSHPYWMKTLGGADGDVLAPYVHNTVHRRQDLPPVYMLDGGIIVLRREGLLTVNHGKPHAFLGEDRRAVVTGPGQIVDVDTAADLALARSILPSHETDGDQAPAPLPPPHPEGESGAFTPPLVIKDRQVDDAHPVYIIAELGVNHDGSVERALELTRAAKETGADAVKLQLFTPRLLLSAEAELAAYQEQTGGGDPLSMLEQLQLSPDQMLRVRELAHELGLGFIVTPFSMENLEQMRGLDPDAVKIASPDAVNPPLIQTMRSLGRPMLTSVGACDSKEVRQAVGAMRGAPAAMLQCVSAYPVPPGCSGISTIGPLRALHGGVVGYSDHTTEVHTGMMAVAAGARLVEKHLTHDRAAHGPDHAASFDPPLFARYVQRVRIAEREMMSRACGGTSSLTAGGGRREVLEIERDVRTVSRQSVCAARDLAAGEVIAREDVTIKRPGTGIAAARLDEVVGRRMAGPVAADHLLREEDVEGVETFPEACARVG